jgi:type VI secretion system protein ImpA
MPATEILDFAELLAPIAGDQPVGADPRSDASPGSAYYAVRDARLANRAAERQLLADPNDGSAPDWRPVLQRGTALLTEHAKDLEIAAYVVEALVRLHGFAGLCDGFRLARELVERYWDDLYPLPDEDGLEARLAPLIGLNGADGDGTLISPILSVPLTEAGNLPPFACYHVQQALALEKVQDENARAKRLQEGSVDLATIEQAVAETSREFYAGLVNDLRQCQDEYASLCRVLDEKCGSHCPPASNVRAALAACWEALDQVAGAKLPQEDHEGTSAADATPTNGQATAGHAPAPPATLSAESIVTRDDAFRLLLKVAEYFRRAEPHSVVSYSLEQVVRWGKMSLPELLRELITDEEPRQQFFRQVGIRSAPAATADAEE